MKERSNSAQDAERAAGKKAATSAAQKK